MTKRTLAVLGAAVVVWGVVAGTTMAGRGAVPAAPARSTSLSGLTPARPAALPLASAPGAFITEFCLECHNQYDLKGELSLETFDPAHPDASAGSVEVAEKMIRKLRLGLMPLVTAQKQPDRAVVTAFVGSLETSIDKAAATHPNPGRRSFQRLNRAEYARAIHDLLSIDEDVNAFLPPDTISAGFDNVADVQAFSPALMEGYMRAASRISRDAVGDLKASPTTVTYKVPRTASQLIRADGAPFGTRGGVSVIQNFPADGEYIFKVMLHGEPTGRLFGLTAKGEQLEYSVNGVRAEVIDINPRMSEADPQGLTIASKPIFIKAGPQRVTAAFIQRAEGLPDDLMAPIEHTLADTQIGVAQGITTLPHVRDFMVTGPMKVTGISDTPSRRRIFSCKPASAAPDDDLPCATKILTSLASEAYRRPATKADVDGLVSFYQTGAKDGGFEIGVRTALQALLASPGFVFRFESTPANARAGQSYRLNDIELASRLSYFLWGGAPDQALVNAALQGALKTPAAGLESQVKRMLQDPRAETLATRFAYQWLRLPDLDPMHPDALLYPHFDQTLAGMMRRETELFFAEIVREDRSVFDLINGDYTYVNDRLADFYGLPNVAGPAFRRVVNPDTNRRGVLGQGSVLVLTSVADRTSPVQRGKWVLEVLLGTSPPPPPANIPPFDDTKAVIAGKALSVRERMEEHRKNPACSPCHRVIDPIGLALENFDVTGAWRIKDNGVPVDPTSRTWDGMTINGPASLRAAIMAHSEEFLRNVTERLMTYGLGRRVEAYDMPAVRAIVADARKQNNTFSAYVLGIVKSAAFQMSRVDDEAPAPKKDIR